MVVPLVATAVVFLEVEEGHLTGVAELVEEELSAKILRVDEHGVVEMRLLDSNKAEVDESALLVEVEIFSILLELPR